MCPLAPPVSGPCPCAVVDTALLYTAGETQKIIGRLLPSFPAGRFKIATKANPWSGGHGGSGGLEPSKLRAQLEQCLADLAVEQVELFYLHAPDVSTPLIDSLREVDALYKEGKFVTFGLSNYSAWETVQAWHICDKNGW